MHVCMYVRRYARAVLYGAECRVPPTIAAGHAAARKALCPNGADLPIPISVRCLPAGRSHSLSAPGSPIFSTHGTTSTDVLEVNSGRPLWRCRWPSPNIGYYLWRACLDNPFLSANTAEALFGVDVAKEMFLLCWTGLTERLMCGRAHPHCIVSPPSIDCHHCADDRRRVSQKKNFAIK